MNGRVSIPWRVEKYQLTRTSDGDQTISRDVAINGWKAIAVAGFYSFIHVSAGINTVNLYVDIDQQKVYWDCFSAVAGSGIYVFILYVPD